MKKTIITLVLAITALYASALDFDFEGSGFTVSPENSVDTTADGRSVVLVDPSGKKLLFTAEAEPTKERIDALLALVAEIRSWKNISASDLHAVNREDGIQISAIPSDFSLEGTSLVEAVPDGLQLFYSSATEYDFKLLSGRYVLRLRGPYTSETDMESQALEAFKDPETFLQGHDPEYLLKRIRVLEEKQAAADRQRQLARPALLAALCGAHPLNGAAVAKLDELKAANSKLTKADAAKALKAAGFSLTAVEIAAVFLVDFGE